MPLHITNSVRTILYFQELYDDCFELLKWPEMQIEIRGMFTVIVFSMNIVYNSSIPETTAFVSLIVSYQIPSITYKNYMLLATCACNIHLDNSGQYLPSGGFLITFICAAVTFIYL